ncbi:MAG: tRNA guanosine(15) transglycosylase TgtA [Candidatus Heimdallarchaeota archaeon]|nr:tRNA guanosine(15) transglycosylase TgtA [Candidatus Heimdallarchaeota archaeon]MCK4253014.1 tRNA guanosine(15) transglycosylase TgtA [Candidatus Heimdallarchaeota archaeon]
MDEIVATDLHGRLAKIKLEKEDVITPTLLPVLDPKNNIISAEEISKKFGFNFIITSAYLFLKRFGLPDDSMKIHEIIDFSGNIMMDSGAYQILAYGDVDIDPLLSLEIQSKLGTDVGVILDVPTPPTDSFQQASQKVDETIKRIDISLEHVKNHPETKWTLPIQGGKNTQLIDRYIDEVSDKGYLDFFKFYALGSVVPIMSQYDYVSLFSMIQTARRKLPYNIPFHLFGAGHPMIFPYIVALGCDTFDSAAYVLYAKENRYMTSRGTYHLSNLIELPCNCEVCSKWTSKELQELDKEERVRNLSLHNLATSSAEIKQIRVSLREGRLWELIEQKAKSHPALFKAFNYILKNTEKSYWELLTPITKQVGLKIFDEFSYYRPEFTRSRRKIIENFSPQSNQMLLFLTSGRKNPIELLFANENLKKIIQQESEKVDVGIFLPFIGVLPSELIETFPFSQYVFSNVISKNLMELVNIDVERFIKEMKYEKIILCHVDSGKEFMNHIKTTENLIYKTVKEVQLTSLKDLYKKNKLNTES